MVKIISTFRGPNPLSKSLASLGKSAFGNGTENAIRSEQLYDLQRKNAETDNLGKMLAAGGASALASNPMAQAELLTSGYKPSDFGAIGLMDAASKYGAASPQAQNMQVGTGQSYGNTASAVDAKLAETARDNNMQSADRRYGVDAGNGEKLYEFNNKPTAVNGPNGPTFAPQGNISAGVFTPIQSEADVKGGLLQKNFGTVDDLTPAQREILGANPPGSLPLSPEVEAQKERIARAGAPKTMGAVPPGYQVEYDASGNPVRMAPIAGSPEAAKLDATTQADAERAQGVQDKANIVIEDIGRLRNIVENAPGATTGLWGTLLKNVPGTGATNAARLTDTIRSNIAFDRLHQMRMESPTGGSLGQISDQEEKMLSSVLGSLDQSQSPDQFIFNLNRLGRVYQRILSKAAAYPNAAQYGFAQGGSNAGSAAPGEPSVPAAPPAGHDDPLGIRQ